MNKQKYIASLVLCALVFGVGGYYVGSKNVKATNGANTTQTGRGAFGANRQGSGGGSGVNGSGARVGRQGGGFTSGEILSIDAQSISLKLQDGGSQVIFYTADTPISKMASGNTSDLSTGESIMVTGKTNPDGSVTAESIQLRPEGRVRTITNTQVTQ